jgi:hypothetical protein
VHEEQAHPAVWNETQDGQTHPAPCVLRTAAVPARPTKAMLFVANVIDVIKNGGCEPTKFYKTEKEVTFPGINLSKICQDQEKHRIDAKPSESLPGVEKAAAPPMEMQNKATAPVLKRMVMVMLLVSDKE